MIIKLIGMLAVVKLAISQELPITFKDGQIGVNFGGYHAEAGLGGILTGNAAHGGLSASAGTPYGQSAKAGLGGNTGPNSRGGLFAEATAGNGVGAEASLAGDLENGFGVGQAAASAGSTKKQIIKTVSMGASSKDPAQNNEAIASIDDDDDNDLTDNKLPTQTAQIPAAVNIQKIKWRTMPRPTIVNGAHHIEMKTTNELPSSTTTSRPPFVYTYDKRKVLNEIFNIPIQVLRSVNEIINQKLANGYTVQKTVAYN